MELAGTPMARGCVDRIHRGAWLAGAWSGQAEANSVAL